MPRRIPKLSRGNSRSDVVRDATHTQEIIEEEVVEGEVEEWPLETSPEEYIKKNENSESAHVQERVALARRVIAAGGGGSTEE